MVCVSTALLGGDTEDYWLLVSPSCYGDVLLVMAQCIVGSMIDALMVGCMFVRISCPKKLAEILFSAGLQP